MPNFSWQSSFAYPSRDVFAWHARPGAFTRLSPPWRTVKAIKAPTSILPGSEVLLKVSALGPLSFTWLLRHGEFREHALFTDEQVRGPFRSWRHRHIFAPSGDSQSSLTDEIEYSLPLLAKPLGWVVAGDLRRLFRFRHALLARDLELHARWGAQPRKRVLIAGSSGFVGQALSAFLSTAGHDVRTLVRRAPAHAHERQWDPACGLVPRDVIEQSDVIIHLGGENISSGRWTAAKKRRLIESRVDSTKALALAISSSPKRPSVFIVASGAGFYGDTGASVADESAPPGESFLAHLAQEWEQAALPVAERGVRAVSLRIGTVLNAAGGALRLMLPAFRAGLGGVLGSGDQRMSWIALEDLLGLIEHAMHTDSLSGPVNAVAPQVITNREFTKALARHLKRPAVIPLPAALLRALFGELADAALLSSCAAAPSKALKSGYSFLFPDISSALAFECP